MCKLVRAFLVSIFSPLTILHAYYNTLNSGFHLKIEYINLYTQCASDGCNPRMQENCSIFLNYHVDGYQDMLYG